MPVRCFRFSRFLPITTLACAACLAPLWALSAQTDSSTAPCGQVISSTATLGDLLQGRLPGVTVIQNGVTSMGARQIRIRGINSTRAKNPIIIVDNIRITAARYTASRGLQSIPLLEVVDPTIISRVEVLKGPAATIQYSDAADGVIRIYTRRGNEQPVVQSEQRTDCRPTNRKP
jgi:outer membrane cobalamin receptor